MFALNDQSLPVNPDILYMVDHNTKVVYNIAFKDGFKITYEPFNNYTLCVFRNNKLFICNKDQFKATTNKDSNRFTVTELPDAADNLVDLKKALEI